MPTRRIIATVCLSLVSVATLSAQSRTRELNEAGWKALEKQDGDRAASLFGEALTLRPNDAVLLLGSGAAAHMQGRERDAITRLQRALELEPRLTTASRLLGEIAYHEGEIDLAIRTYEKALKRAPDNAELTARLQTWRTEAELHHDFEERRYDRFKVMFEGRSEEALAIRATAVLKSAFWRIGEALGAYPDNPVIVILYTEKQFRDVTRAPEWSDGRYDGRIRLPVRGASQNLEAFDRVLTHELTHAMVASIAPRGVPTWLHEGLAQYFEAGGSDGGIKRARALQASVPLKDLEGSFDRMTAAEAQVAYAESLSAVRVLFERPGFGWTRLLHELADGQPFGHVIERFGFSYADLETDFTHATK